jgi:hypothetical protein
MKFFTPHLFTVGLDLKSNHTSRWKNKSLDIFLSSCYFFKKIIWELVETFVGSCLRRLARSSAAPSRGEGVRTSGGVSTRSGSGRLRRTAQGELVWRRSPLTRRSRSSLLSSRAASLIFLRGVRNITSGRWNYSDVVQHYYRGGILWITESIATLPPFGLTVGHKWFDQISSHWGSQKNRFAFISFGKIQFLPPCIWNLPFMSYRIWGRIRWLRQQKRFFYTFLKLLQNKSIRKCSHHTSRCYGIVTGNIPYNTRTWIPMRK